MTAKTKILSTLGLALTLAASGAGWPGLASATSSAATFPDDDKTILHVVNRIAFGPRPGKEGEPGDVVKIREMGLQRYIDQQLHPDRIPDSDMGARLAGLETIGMSSRDRRRWDCAAKARRERRGNRAWRAKKVTSAEDAERNAAEANRVVLELSNRNCFVRSQRAAAAGPHRFLVQPFQRRRAQGPRPFHADRVRARRHPSPRARHIPRPARSDGQEPRDALLPR